MLPGKFLLVVVVHICVSGRHSSTSKARHHDDEGRRERAKHDGAKSGLVRIRNGACESDSGQEAAISLHKQPSSVLYFGASAKLKFVYAPSNKDVLLINSNESEYYE